MTDLPVPTNEAGITLGQQQLDAGDLMLPRVKVTQQMSDEAQGGKAARAVPGDLWNTLTGENLGNELLFIPIITFKQRVFLVRRERREKADQQLASVGLDPVSEGDGLKCRSFDMFQGVGDPGIACGECPLSKWVDDRPPLCTETYNVAALTASDGDLIVLSFAKSSARTGKRVFSMLRLTTANPWSKVYRITTREDRNDQGTFYVPDVAVTQERPVPELMRAAGEWARRLGAATVVNVSGEDDEPGEGAEPTTEDF